MCGKISSVLGFVCLFFPLGLSSESKSERAPAASEPGGPWMVLSRTASSIQGSPVSDPDMKAAAAAGPRRGGGEAL